MIKIYLPDINNKFYNNIRLIKIKDLIIEAVSFNNIYRLNDMHRADIYIFDGDSISNEISQFISEFGPVNNKIYIYHNYLPNKDVIRYIKQATHIVNKDFYDEFKMYNNIIKLPENLINKDIYYNKNNIRSNNAIYFLDLETSIPKSLDPFLYPNKSDYRILLFNNHNIRHVQNMGLLSEYDKAEVLNESTYFIVNKQYATEAVACGCRLLSIEDLKEINHQQYTDNVVTYQDFIKGII